MEGILYVCITCAVYSKTQCCASTGLLEWKAKEDPVKQCGTVGGLITPSRTLTLPHHFRLNCEQPLPTTVFSHNTAPDAVSTGKLTFSLIQHQPTTHTFRHTNVSNFNLLSKKEIKSFIQVLQLMYVLKTSINHCPFNKLQKKGILWSHY